MKKQKIHKQKVLKCPKHIKPYRNNKKTICIDYGIIQVIKLLWEHKIVTLGCCCNKGGSPTVLLGNDYRNDDIEIIKKLISKIDKREWSIGQWRNVEVGKKRKPAHIGLIKTKGELHKTEWAKKL